MAINNSKNNKSSLKYADEILLNQKNIKPTRKDLREKYADEMCREVRFQIANNFHNEQTLFVILEKWMRVAKKTKYIRPKF